MKRIIALFLAFFVLVSLSACGEEKVLKSSYDELQASLQNQIAELQKHVSDLEAQNSELTQKVSQAEEDKSSLEQKLEIASKENEELTAKIDDLENGPAALIVSIRNAAEEEKWEEVVELADDLHARANGSEEDVEGQKFAEAAKKAIEKAEAEAAAAKAKEYDTGITFDQVSRNPDDYKNQKVKFSGRVFQSFVDGSNTNIMMFANGNFGSVMYITIATSSLESRVLENDWITVRGVFNGLYTYESSGNGVLSVPWVKADSIER